jgi:membrane protein implicated in regulation of membrane protease activity
VVTVNGFLSWWDGVELWLSGLPFVLQALAVMPVVLALAYLVATVLDGLLGKGIQLLRRARHTDEPAGP